MKTFNDVIQTLISTNEKLIKGEISIETAKTIASNTQVLINATRLQLDVVKFQDNKKSLYLSEIEPISETLKEIEENKLKPVNFG